MPYSPPKYPGQIPTTDDLPDRIDDVDWLYAARYNELKKELRAVMVELGILPKGEYDHVTARLNALEAAIVPTGMIAMWSGLLANIPAGWELCDGQDGRPDLLDKFVKAVPNDETDPGSQGGSHTLIGNSGDHHLSEAEMPAHTHSGRFANLREDSSGSDTVYYINKEAVTESGSKGGDESHAHSLEGINNKPAYYEVAFIIKT